MKANELMIGDWVQGFLPDTNSKVVGILNDIQIAIIGGGAYMELDVDDLQPIPLTPEILEKNGFVLSKESSRKPYQLRDNSIYVSVIKGRLNARYYEKFGKPINAMQIDCNYVHELQHALRLCGIEKEIVL